MPRLFPDRAAALPDTSPAALSLICLRSTCQLSRAASKLLRQRLVHLQLVEVEPWDSWRRELRRMASLSTLTMLDCDLGDSAEELGQLKSLRSLDLTACRLGRVPRALAELPGLTQLCLSVNPGIAEHGVLFPDCASVLSRLTQLRDLDVASCGLSRVPEGICQLTALTKLSLRGQEAGLLDLGNLAGLTQLRDLNLCESVDGPADELPAALSALTNLERLDLTQGRGMVRPLGSVPAFVSNLTALVELRMNNTGIEADWQHLRPLTRLRKLSIRGCDMRELPMALHAVTQLY